MSKFPLRLKELRQAQGKSIKDFAQEFNVTERSVQRWETGEHVPDIETIISIAKFFGETTNYLLGVVE